MPSFNQSSGKRARQAHATFARSVR